MYTQGFKGKRYTNGGYRFQGYGNGGNGGNGRYKRGYGNGGYRNNNGWNKVKRDIRQLKRVASTHEYKFVSTSIDDAVIATGGTVQTQLFTIAQGDGRGNREGRKITLTSIQCRFILSLPPTNMHTETSELMRIIILHDKQANGALPAVLDILLTAGVQSFKNLEQTQRFRTLLDRTMTVTSQTGAWDGTNPEFGEDIIFFDWYKKLNIPIMYDNSLTTGVIATIVSNNIVALYISRTGIGAIEGQFQFRYLDS